MRNYSLETIIRNYLFFSINIKNLGTKIMFQGTKKNENLCKFITPTVQYGFIMEISILTHHRMMFSHEVMSDSLWPNGLQYTRFPCPSPSPRVCSSSCALSQCPIISFSVNLFSFCPQSFPESASFQMSQFFASGSQSIGASASISVLPITTNSRRWEYQTTWPASWEICMQVRKQQLELDMEQQTGSK